MLATESLKLVQDPERLSNKEDGMYMENFKEYLKLAEIYQAYNLVSRYLEESYRSQIQGELLDESVFNASRFLVNNLGKRSPKGINNVYIYYTLATLGFKFEAYKTAREGFEML